MTLLFQLSSLTAHNTLLQSPLIQNPNGGLVVPTSCPATLSLAQAPAQPLLLSNPSLQNFQMALAGASGPQQPAGLVLGQSPTDLQSLQMALQQQQQSLQQQLQSFLLLQPGTAQASAMLLHSQVQQAVTQATNQLRLLQRHRELEKSKQQLLQDTPKSNPRPSPPFQETVLSKISKVNNRKVSPTAVSESSGVNKRLTHPDSGSSPPLKMSLKHLTPVSFSLPKREVPEAAVTASSHTTSTSNTVPISLPQPLIPDPQLLTQVKLDLPADENVDLEELEQFAKDFKQRRIKLGKE